MRPWFSAACPAKGAAALVVNTACRCMGLMGKVRRDGGLARFVELFPERIHAYPAAFHCFFGSAESRVEYGCLTRL
jgi:hypothetical protein